MRRLIALVLLGFGFLLSSCGIIPQIEMDFDLEGVPSQEIEWEPYQEPEILP